MKSAAQGNDGQQKSKYGEEQVVGFPTQAGAEMPVAEICRGGGFSKAAFDEWRSASGGMEASDANRPGEPEPENAERGKPPGRTEAVSVRLSPCS